MSVALEYLKILNTIIRTSPHREDGVGNLITISGLPTHLTMENEKLPINQRYRNEGLKEVGKIIIEFTQENILVKENETMLCIEFANQIQNTINEYNFL